MRQVGAYRDHLLCRRKLDHVFELPRCPEPGRPGPPRPGQTEWPDYAAVAADWDAGLTSHHPGK